VSGSGRRPHRDVWLDRTATPLFAEALGVSNDWVALSDPRVRKLDDAATQVCLDLCEAIEAAVREGVPAAVIARFAKVPESQVGLIADELCEGER
jgi:hypothetical protein